MVLERQDGSLLMLLRSRQGTTQCESFDQGATWSNPVRTAFPNACARFFLRRLASGKALLVKHSNPDQPLARSHLTAYLSDDDGATWTGGLTLDERTGVSYPDGFQAPDGRIFIQYDYKREGGEILLAVFTEEDVAAGRPVSGETRLAHPVLRTRRRRLAAAG
jgi:predicted neuraminidase